MMENDPLDSSIKKLKGLTFDIGPIRPPSEGGSHSLLIRATRNCPWSMCAFCYGMPYNREKFQLRPVEEIKRDIQTVASIADELKNLEGKLGGMDWVSRVVDPYFLYGKGFADLGENESKNFQCLVNVFNWLASGARTVFLQDANSLIMKTPDLVEVIKYLRRVFPTLGRITSYARSQTLTSKKIEELRELRDAGLDRLHVGMETGDDELLKRVNKGVTAKEHIEGGRKSMEVGFELSLYIMPGLGGKAMSEQHARNTSRVLNEINPTFIRIRPFVPRPGTPMFEEWRRGALKLLTPHELLKEMMEMIGGLEVTGRICFDHFINGLIDPFISQDYSGYKLPEQKKIVLKELERGLEADESRWAAVEELIRDPSFYL